MAVERVPATGPVSENLIFAAMFFGVLVPPVGLILGGLIVSKGDRRGWWVVGLAAVVLGLAATLAISLL